MKFFILYIKNKKIKIYYQIKFLQGLAKCKIYKENKYDYEIIKTEI